MPCLLEAATRTTPARAVYATRATPASSLELGASGGVSIRAVRRRDDAPYKRYVTSTCRRQRDWPAVRRMLQQQTAQAAEETRAQMEQQRQYDQRMEKALEPILAHMRAFRGASNRRLFADLAARIDALDLQGRVALTPWLARSALSKAKNLKNGFANHPKLRDAKQHAELLVESLETHDAQLDFTDCTPRACPRIAPHRGDEGVDPWDQAPYVPTLTTLVLVHEEGVDRNMCIPWESVRAAGDAAPVQTPGQSVWSPARREYIDRPGGEPFAATQRLMPAHNDRLAAEPFVVPVLRIRRLSRP